DYTISTDCHDDRIGTVTVDCANIDPNNPTPTVAVWEVQGDGSCIILGCTYSDADNYNSLANDDDSSCTFTLGSDCPADLDNDGVAATSDLLLFLTAFGATCN
ncbi:MAG: hypothetical protein HOH96_05600, partial [Flavobacteriales bacterium]|nr:hypothetical protein [Flavobacteriales bacterium]